MRWFALVLVFSLVPAVLPAATALETVTVSLVVTTDLGAEAGLDPGAWAALPGTAACTVTVPAGGSAADVLDQATADGCILGWTYTTFGDERFVTGVDGLEAVGLTCLAWPVACQWWEFQVDGSGASTGVDGHTVTAGETLGFLFHSA